MSKLRNTVLGSLAGVLFSITVACGGQPALPTLTPTLIQQTTQSPSGVINSVRNYKPSENEIRTAEAIKYLSSSSDRQSARNYVLQNYGEDGNRAIRLVDNAETYRQQIVQNGMEGKPYTINELQSMMNTDNLLELSMLLDAVYGDVYVLHVGENEMVGFRNAVRNYKEFREAVGVDANGNPDISPGLETVTAYTVIFFARSLHQDPITAHTYALAIAKDEEAREGTVLVIWDLYMGGKNVSKATQEKLKESGITSENISRRINDFREQKVEEARQTIQDMQESVSQWLKKKNEEIQREEQEQRKEGQETRGNVKEFACENWPKFIPTPEACK